MWYLYGSHINDSLITVYRIHISAFLKMKNNLLNLLFTVVVVSATYPILWSISMHDDVITWKHFPRYWPLVWGIHRWPVNSPRKGQWRVSALLAICVWTSVTGEFPTQRPVTRSFVVFVDLRLNKRLSKQSWGWWFETPCRSPWRHCNVKAASQLF